MTFSLFVVSLVITTILAVMIELSTMWARLPQFVWNYVGGVMAVCSVADFNHTKKFGLKFNQKVMVPQTIVFSDAESEYSSGLLEWRHNVPYPAHGAFRESRKDETLFVPFASEGWQTYDEQKKYFVWPQDPMAFAKRKKQENLEADYRMRVAAWCRKHDLGICLSASIFATVVAGIIFCVQLN